MLTGAEIKRLVEKGEIRISDFSEERLNPNSYNLRLGDKLLVYDIPFTKMVTQYGWFPIYPHGAYLDSRKKNPTKEIIIPEEGFILQPGIFYLGTTMESTYAENHIANIDGRSSAARLSLEIHRTAGFGDIGFDGTWTLEMTTMLPLKIYPGQEICQVYFETPEGDTSIKYKGRYQHQDGTTASRLYMTKEQIGCSEMNNNDVEETDDGMIPDVPGLESIYNFEEYKWSKKYGYLPDRFK